jgi:hypothetical protein
MKKMIIYFMLFMVLILNVLSFDTSDNTYWLSLDDTDLNSDEYYDLSDNDLNFTQSDGTTGATGIINEAYTTDNNAILTSETSADFDHPTVFTQNLWVNFANQASIQVLYRSDGTGTYTTLEYHTDDTFRWIHKPTTTSYCNMGFYVSGIDDNAWHMITLVKNASDSDCDQNFHTFIDGVEVASTILDSNGNKGNEAFDSNNVFYLGNKASKNIGFVGTIDEVSLFKRELEADEIVDLYNSGDGLNIYATQESTPQPANFTLSTDLTHNVTTSTNPYSFNISAIGTVQNTTTNSWTIKIYLNNTLNKTVYSTVNLNESEFPLNISYSELGYDVNITVNNSEVSKYVWREDLYIDDVNPVITDNQNINNTQWKDTTPITSSYTCSDTGLYLFNRTLATCGRSSIIESVQIDSLTGTSYTNSTSRTLSQGCYEETIICKDGHTINIIPDITWEKYQFSYAGDTYKGISFANNFLNMTTKEYQKVNDYYLVKQQDRYIEVFNFDASAVGQVFTMYLDSKKDMKYLDYTEYAGHFIIGDYWKDYVSNDISNLQIDYLENYGVYRVRFVPLKQIVVFHSLGIINSVEKTYTFDVVANMTIEFKSQIPADLNVSNVITTQTNITYNVSDLIGVDSDSVTIFYKTNSTTSDTIYYINGLAYSGWQTRDVTTSNVSNIYQFLLNDNLILPGSYNYDEEVVEDATHYTLTLNTSNSFIMTKHKNVTGDKLYGFFESAYNRSDSTAIELYTCNETYITTGGKVISSDYCTGFNSEVWTEYDHCHSSTSCHNYVPFVLNTTSQQINGIGITNTMYSLIRGKSGSITNVYYVDINVDNDTTQITTNGGNNWLNLSILIDSHFHQFNSVDTFYHYVCANDTSNPAVEECSVVTSDTLALLELPPSSPIIIYPNETTVEDQINITYFESISPNGYDIILYNISLHYSNETYIQTLTTNNSLNLFYLWNTTEVVNGNYVIKVTAVDSFGFNSYDFSETFTISNPDVIDPELLTISNSSVNTSGFTVSATFNESVNMTLYVHTSLNFSQGFTFNETDYSASQSAVASGLINNTLYYWKINGTDISGNWYNSDVYNVTTSQTTQETEEPAGGGGGGGGTSFTVTDETIDQDALDQEKEKRIIIISLIFITLILLVLFIAFSSN